MKKSTPKKISQKKLKVADLGKPAAKSRRKPLINKSIRLSATTWMQLAHSAERRGVPVGQFIRQTLSGLYH